LTSRFGSVRSEVQILSPRLRPQGQVILPPLWSFSLRLLTTRLLKMTSRVVSTLKNLANRETARMDKVAPVWSQDAKSLLKRPHGSSML
jgi:hypothetical protein